MYRICDGIHWGLSEHDCGMFLIFVVTIHTKPELVSIFLGLETHLSIQTSDLIYLSNSYRVRKTILSIISSLGFFQLQDSPICFQIPCTQQLLREATVTISGKDFRWLSLSN